MRTRLASVALFSLAAFATGCTALGPKANVTMVEHELTQTKSVKNIVIASPVGVADPNGTLDKSVAATAIAAYGGRSRPATVLDTTLSAVGAPSGLGAALLAPYHAEFLKVVTAYDPDPAKKMERPTKMALPSGELPGVSFDFKDAEGLKKILEQVGKEVQAIGSVAQTIQSGNVGNLAVELGKSQALSPLLVMTNGFLFEQMEVDHVLLTHVSGTQADYAAGNPIRITAALVNVKTGNFRFFADIQGKSVPGLPYEFALANMANNLFSAASDADPGVGEAAAEKTAEGKTSEEPAKAS